MSGVPTASIGAIACSASSSEPTMHQTTMHAFRRWISSGNGGPGGTVWNAKNPVALRERVGRNSRYAESTSSVCSSGHSVGPPTTSETGCAWKVNSVTTPKLPPPPRSAQNRSAFSSALAVTRCPSASTT